MIKTCENRGMDSENDLQQYVKQILADNPFKLVLSGPDGMRETLRRLSNGYQAERIVNRQAFQNNLTGEEMYPYVLSRFEEGYRQLNAWSESYEYNLRVAKRGRALFSRKANKHVVATFEQHNRVKNYILPEGEVVPPLVDMGIFTPDGKVVPSRYDKYKQINRFLEMMDDTLGGIGEGEELHVVDFGCGKSYLTFILYYYLYKVKKIQAVVTGVDLKADVIADCNKTAKKYGYDVRVSRLDVGEWRIATRRRKNTAMTDCRSWRETSRDISRMTPWMSSCRCMPATRRRITPCTMPSHGTRSIFFPCRAASMN